MDPQTLVNALDACQSPDPSIRKAAEDALNQVRPPRRARRCGVQHAIAAAAAPTAVAAHPAGCAHLVASPAWLDPQHKYARGQIVNLLRVALEESVDPAVRQVAAISFKNLVKRDWEAEGAWGRRFAGWRQEPCRAEARCWREPAWL
jgi:hypothetical protein